MCILYKKSVSEVYEAKRNQPLPHFQVTFHVLITGYVCSSVVNEFGGYLFILDQTYLLSLMAIDL